MFGFSGKYASFVISGTQWETKGPGPVSSDWKLRLLLL